MRNFLASVGWIVFVGNGLLDGEEIDTEMIQYNPGMPSDVVSNQRYFFLYSSYPDRVDSDKDYILDGIDVNPLDINFSEEELNKKASKKIEENALYIINAANIYNIDPCTVAACIFAEQDLNYDLADILLDGILSFYSVVDMPVGLGQVRMSTAKFLEDKGYVEKAKETEFGWDIPLIGFVHGTEDMAREKRSENNEVNTIYVAAYIKYFIDNWSSEFTEISNRPDILATLFNLGHGVTPHSEPKANDFGKYADKYYYMMYLLLYGGCTNNV